MTMEEKRHFLAKKLIFLGLILFMPVTYDQLQTLFYTVLFYIGEAVFHYDQQTIDTLYNSHSYMADSIFCALVLLLYLPWYWRVRHKERLLMIEPHKKQLNLKTIFKTVIITFGIGGISYLWFIIIDVVKNLSPSGQDTLGLGESMDHFTSAFAPIDQEAYIWVFLSVVLLGPLVEELIFRGIQYYYAERVRRGWFPILITALSFGVWHGILVQSIYTALMGIAIAIVYRHTRSILIPFLMHIINNFMSTLPPALDHDIVYTMYDSICLLMILPAIYLLIQMLVIDHKKEKSIRLQEQELLQKAILEAQSEQF